MDKSNGSFYKRIYIQRDFSKGTGIRFQNKFPAGLEKHINNQIWINFIDQLNVMYKAAEQMDSRICCESCFACLTAYLTYLCFESYFDKCLKRISAFIEEQNDTVFKPCGLFVVDPVDRGLRVIEIIVRDREPHGHHS